MSAVLNLGVNDLPYSHSSNLGRVKKGKTKGRQRTSTTGEVAVILEDKYHIMQHFWDLHQEDIIGYLSDAIEGSFESLMMGAPPSPDAYAAGTSKIEALFARFLSEKQMDFLEPGVPTKASLLGISQRFKKRRGPVRPSFIDSALFESSMKAWVDNDSSS